MTLKEMLTQKELIHSSFMSLQCMTDRTKLGSQWAWLCHQITTLNQKLFQLDSLIQSQPPKETVQFMAHNPFTVPCVCGLQNGHTLLFKSFSPTQDSIDNNMKTPTVNPSYIIIYSF